MPETTQFKEWKAKLRYTFAKDLLLAMVGTGLGGASLEAKADTALQVTRKVFADLDKEEP